MLKLAIVCLVIGAAVGFVGGFGLGKFKAAVKAKEDQLGQDIQDLGKKL